MFQATAEQIKTAGGGSCGINGIYRLEGDAWEFKYTILLLKRYCLRLNGLLYFKRKKHLR